MPWRISIATRSSLREEPSSEVCATLEHPARARRAVVARRANFIIFSRVKIVANVVLKSIIAE
jgi:hypothetical protein